MAESALTPLVRCLSRLAGHPASDLSDAELLERYRQHGEEAALALLVQRHGPAVSGVCRRALGNTADADDAFQATFLVLLSRAGSIRRGESLGCWLYGVALRVAAKARCRRPVRRLGRDVETSADDPVREATRRELLAVLDEEIGGLPEKYRAALVLCGIGGRTCEQAARELGWPKSTLILRLRSARQRLRQRLTRRGIEIPAALLAAALAHEAAAARVPALLTLATVRAARGGAGAASAARLAAGGVSLKRWAVVVLGLAGVLGTEGEQLWNGLNDADAAAAFAAIRRLLTRPGPAVELLRGRLRPAPAFAEKTVRGLLRDLDADDFAARTKAAADLEAVADRAEAVLRKVLAENPTAETKRQIERALEAARPFAPGRRRELRAVEVLERLGTSEARELLAALAGGAKESLLTREARSAVGRLKGR